MKHVARSGIAAISVLVLGVSGFAQARSAFLDVLSESDISVFVSPNLLTYTLALGAAPTFTAGNQTYHVTDAFAFYSLSNTGANLGASGVDQNFWKYTSTQNDTAGWTNNPKNHVIIPNGSLALTYTAINHSKIDTFGVHVSTKEFFPGTAGNTGFIALHPVPEPGMVTGLMGAVGLLSIRLRRRFR